MLNHKLRRERKQLLNGDKPKNRQGKTTRTITGTKSIRSKLLQYNIDDEQLDLISNGEYDFSIHGDNAKMLEWLVQEYFDKKERIAAKTQKIKATKNKLLKLLENKTNQNLKTNGKDHIRTLRQESVCDKNIISVFDSTFTRTIGATVDELSEDFMVVQVYFFSIIKDLIHYGFMYNGEKYIYFTSSAGQIRTKKTVFIKESVWKKHEKTLMCGLTIDKINEKGGMNINKLLAYMALNCSATDVWEEFDISKTIVVDDFETEVYGTYDLVDETDYSITRKEGYVPIPHTDGCGMILPEAFGVKQRNVMVRLPFVKGLLGVFDFHRFIEENNCSPIVKDIYGVEHDIIAEDIQVVFTKSQTKLWKYYDNWRQYQEYFRKYNCSAATTNPEEKHIKNSTINYQMLQSLTDITDKEIVKLATPSINRLKDICSSVENIKDVFGITAYNQDKTAFQKAVEVYPELLNDVYVRAKLKDIKDSLIKRYKSGKLQVNGKYTFVLPDLYAACEHWFMGKENPDGLLEDKEVYCRLFSNYKKVDCLRSPHLFCEHAIRDNVAHISNQERDEKIRDWFCTNAIYTSCKDLISKILQFDDH